MPRNVGGEGARWPRADTVKVAHNDNGRIHLWFGEDLNEEDIRSINMLDSVDTRVQRKPVKVLGLRLK